MTRLRMLVARGVKPEAAKATLRAEVLAVKGDKAGSQKALEEATTLDPKLVSAHLTLALRHEEAKAYDEAIERYRKVLAIDPNNVLALNNLAYGLAVHRGQAAGALEYAERAQRLTGGKSVEIADTLAWIQHLLGRDAEAVALLETIVKTAPAGSEYRLHLAEVYAALGKLTEAASELQEALRLSPDLEKRDDVVALRAKLKQANWLSSCAIGITPLKHV